MGVNFLSPYQDPEPTSSIKETRYRENQSPSNMGVIGGTNLKNKPDSGSSTNKTQKTLLKKPPKSVTKYYLLFYLSLPEDCSLSNHSIFFPFNLSCFRNMHLSNSQ